MRREFKKRIFILFLFSNYSYSSVDLIDLDFDDIEFKNILSSTRLKTSHREAPASISIITAEDIEKYKFRNLPEALKTIPGFFVAESHSSYDHYFVGYHGGNSNVPRRTNLIIDGISFYQTGLSRVHWEKLPLIMSDIFSIEVIRGPAASLYGSNSFTSVVNVTTKKPKETLGLLNSNGFSFDALLGELNERDVSISYTSNFENLYYRLSFSHVQDDGFDSTSSNDSRRDSLNVNHFTLKGTYSINDTSEIEFEIGHTDHNQQEQFIVSYQNEFPDYQQNITRGSLKYSFDPNPNHNLQIFSYFKSFDQIQTWNANVPAYLTSPELGNLSIINPEYANSLALGINPFGSGGGVEADNQTIIAIEEINSIGDLAFVPINLDVPQNFSAEQFEIEIQDTLSFKDNFRLLTGISVRKVFTRSHQWVINGDINSFLHRAFANVEWVPYDDLILNGGLMYEHDKESGVTLSPRLALSYHFSPEHSFRYIYSTATRTPDIFEQHADWRLIGENYSFNPWGNETLTFYARGISQGMLNPEEITSNEIGYYYLSSTGNTEIDIRIFREYLSELISEKLEIRNFDPTNNGYAKKTGGDFHLKKRILDNLSLSLSYSYIDINSVVLEKTITPRHIGSVSFSYEFNEKTSLSFSYYGYSKLLASSPSSDPDIVTSTDPLNSLDIIFQYKPFFKSLPNLQFFVKSRLRNGNPEVQIDNNYDSRLNTSIGFKVDL